MATWEERIRNTLGGIKLDPKANALPGEGAIPYMGRRIKEAAVDAFKPLQENVVAPLNKFLFGTAPVESKDNSIIPSPVEEVARRQKMPMINMANTVTRPEGTATFQPGTGVATPESGNFKELIGQSPQAIANRKSLANRISPENPYGADVVNMPAGRMQVGARTDAEAARNLQDRASQDQATQAEVARLNRATDAMRSLREAQSPRFSFGASSIGGGPDTLDVASGRVINRDTPASVVASRMQDTVDTARRFGGFGGGKTGRLIAAEMGKIYLADKQLQGIEAQMAGKQQQSAVDPVDMGRFLLDQQKFAQQQGIDKARLNMDVSALQDKQASTALERQKYTDAQQKEFLNNYIAPEGAPIDELKSGILAMSKATGLSPDIMNTYLQRVAAANNVDWENAPPKNLKQLYEKAVALAASENK